ncbi:phosphatidic acid phosphatase [Pararhizobium polonicum]|uniref:Phosphatidic acid phosphatase n=1 Tax=Pararhizobium polonicum TaxID=1612624 RepID=A0A1C7NXA1_9HYPH|nr:phosphatase PAP2 family protein [Pararhizobium polonicum]OBZ93635.1 phosphatidic acid phosphatase [Pararhizobium polonicum]
MNRLLSTSLWLLLAASVLIAALLPFDGALSQWAQALPHGVVAFNKRITDFGTFAWMIYSSGSIVIIAYILHRVSRSEGFSSKAGTGWRLALYFLGTIGSAGLLVQALKLIIGRARPALYLEYGAHSLTPFAREWQFESFPSGHSAAVGAFFGAFAMLAPRFRPVFALGALTIGISRVIVGAHYPSDVVAGLSLGFWSALMIAFLFARQNWLFRLDDAGWPRTKV